MTKVVDIETERRARECGEELVASLEELALVVDLALMRLRSRQRWSGTQLLLTGLATLARDVRQAADGLDAEVGARSTVNGSKGTGS